MPAGSIPEGGRVVIGDDVTLGAGAKVLFRAGRGAGRRRRHRRRRQRRAARIDRRGRDLGGHPRPPRRRPACGDPMTVLGIDHARSRSARPGCSAAGRCSTCSRSPPCSRRRRDCCIGDKGFPLFYLAVAGARRARDPAPADGDRPAARARRRIRCARVARASTCSRSRLVDLGRRDQLRRSAHLRGAAGVRPLARRRRAGRRADPAGADARQHRPVRATWRSPWCSCSWRGGCSRSTGASSRCWSGRPCCWRGRGWPPGRLAARAVQTMPGLPYQNGDRAGGHVLRAVGARHVPDRRRRLLRCAAAHAPHRAPPVAPVRRVSRWSRCEFVANGSGTALIGLALVTGLGGVVLFVRIARSRSAAGAAGRSSRAALAVVAVGAHPDARAARPHRRHGRDQDRLLSFVARDASNDRSIGIVLDTLGLGVGLGGNRPSSLPLFVVSCLGVVGRRAAHRDRGDRDRPRSTRRRSSRRPGRCSAALTAGAVAVPDLSTPLHLGGARGVHRRSEPRRLDTRLTPPADRRQREGVSARG